MQWSILCYTSSSGYMETLEDDRTNYRWDTQSEAYGLFAAWQVNPIEVKESIQSWSVE